MKILDKFELPKEISAAKGGDQLMAQAVRVHLANQRQGTQSALTRAEVNRTRKKYQKQKGSGNARHGDRKAPIFVGGGIAFAPKPRDFSLALPYQMKRAAINSALSAKNKAGALVGVSGMDKASGKTKEIAEIIDSRTTLIVTDSYRENVYRAARNISGVVILPVAQINVYEILKADKIIMMEEAVKEMNAPKEAKKEEKIEKGKEVSKIELKKVLAKKVAPKKPKAKKAAIKKVTKKTK